MSDQHPNPLRPPSGHHDLRTDRCQPPSFPPHHHRYPPRHPPPYHNHGDPHLQHHPPHYPIRHHHHHHPPHHPNRHHHHHQPTGHFGGPGQCPPLLHHRQQHPPHRHHLRHYQGPCGQPQLAQPDQYHVRQGVPPPPAVPRQNHPPGIPLSQHTHPPRALLATPRNPGPAPAPLSPFQQPLQTPIPQSPHRPAEHPACSQGQASPSAAAAGCRLSGEGPALAPLPHSFAGPEDALCCLNPPQEVPETVTGQADSTPQECVGVRGGERGGPECSLPRQLTEEQEQIPNSNEDISASSGQPSTTPPCTTSPDSVEQTLRSGSPTLQDTESDRAGSPQSESPSNSAAASSEPSRKHRKKSAARKKKKGGRNKDKDTRSDQRSFEEQKQLAKEIYEEEMQQQTKEMFPQLHNSTLHLPPQRFNKTAVARDESRGLHVYQPCWPSDQGSERAESDVRRCLDIIRDVTGEKMCVLFNYSFDNYLEKNASQPSTNTGLGRGFSAMLLPDAGLLGKGELGRSTTLTTTAAGICSEDDANLAESSSQSIPMDCSSQQTWHNTNTSATPIVVPPEEIRPDVDCLITYDSDAEEKTRIDEASPAMFPSPSAKTFTTTKSPDHETIRRSPSAAVGDNANLDGHKQCFPRPTSMFRTADNATQSPDLQIPTPAAAGDRAKLDGHKKRFPKPKLLFATPDDLEKDIKRGDFDVLIVSPRHGFLVMEIKGVGYNQVLDLAVLRKKVELAAQQLFKQETVLCHLFGDAVEGMAVRKVLALPNVPRHLLRSACHQDDQFAQMLCSSFQAPSLEEALCTVLCADDLPPSPPHTPLTPPTPLQTSSHHALLRWWSHVTKTDNSATIGDNPGTGSQQREPEKLDASVYERVIARLAGPYSKMTVESTRRASEARTVAQCIHLTGIRFGRDVLREDQVRILDSQDPFVFLTGPPGSGKTLMLGMKGVEWARRGDHVVVFVPRGVGWGSFVSASLYERIKQYAKGTPPHSTLQPEPRKTTTSSTVNKGLLSKEEGEDAGQDCLPGDPPVLLHDSSDEKDSPKPSSSNEKPKPENHKNLNSASGSPSSKNGDQTDTLSIHTATVEKKEDTEKFVEQLLHRYCDRPLRIVVDEGPTKVSVKFVHGLLRESMESLRQAALCVGCLEERARGTGETGSLWSPSAGLVSGPPPPSSVLLLSSLLLCSSEPKLEKARSLLSEVRHHLQTISDRLHVLQPAHGRPPVTQSEQWQTLISQISAFHARIADFVQPLLRRLATVLRPAASGVCSGGSGAGDVHEGTEDAPGANESPDDASGSAEGVLNVSGSAEGVLNVSGSAEDAINVSGSAEDAPDVAESADGVLGVSGSAEEVPNVSGCAADVSDVFRSAKGALDNSGTMENVPNVPESTENILDVSRSPENVCDVSGSTEDIPNVSRPEQDVSGMCTPNVNTPNQSAVALNQNIAKAFPDTQQHPTTAQVDTATSVQSSDTEHLQGCDCGQTAFRKTGSARNCSSNRQTVGSQGDQPGPQGGQVGVGDADSQQNVSVIKRDGSRTPDPLEVDDILSVLDQLEACMLEASGKLFNVETQMDFFVISDVLSLLVKKRESQELSVWSSGVMPFYQPQDFLAKSLTHCLRCPPTVQHVLSLVEKDLVDCPGYAYTLSSLQDGHYPLPTDGPPIKLLDHGIHVTQVKDILDCRDCGRSLADYLINTLRIDGDSGLRQEDVSICGSFDIISSVQGRPFMQSLTQGTPIRLQTLEMTSPQPRPGGVVLIGGCEFQGLENKVVVFIPDVSRISHVTSNVREFRPGLPDWLRQMGRWNRCHLWFLASRCLSQLVVFHV